MRLSTGERGEVRSDQSLSSLSCCNDIRRADHGSPEQTHFHSPNLSFLASPDDWRLGHAGLY